MAPAETPGSAETPNSTASTWRWGLNLLLVALGLAAGFTFAFQQLHYHWNWSGPWRYRALFWQGWFTTVALAGASLLVSTTVGVAAALLGRSRLLPARALVRLYVEGIRGTPFLVQILLLFYVIAPAFRLENRLAVGVLALSLFSGAYITEIIRGGIEGIGKSQWETARAIGLTRTQTYRHVVLPQALRSILPALAGQFVSLIKDSSLLSVIGIGEFALQAQQVNSQTYSTLESYLPLALGYLVLTLPLSLWTRRLERRAHFDT
ncbi:MAG: amino acid ABC transporter permease [Verrucomicrobiales bacterium]|nr:amino acid ABC transporter permease [Verrucomicrobiales bacterium]